mgnify:CR=1 FL=1
MLKITRLFFLIFSLSIAQTNEEKWPKHELTRDKSLFDEEKIKQQIDSLNKKTPMNLIYNKTVGQHIQFYINQRPGQVAKLLALSEYYFPIFEKFLDKNELPLELKYLPIIESSLNPHARSYAGAVGLWQFMYLTAKEYGLRVNSYLDERKDINKSTQAACRYLKRAHSNFNNWDLALSAYNAGERNVKKAIRRSGGKSNYWEIRPFLPKETRNYIPSFIAAVYAMNFASEYGIQPDTNHLFKEMPTDSVYLRRAVKIEHLATLLDINIATIEKLNPVYRTKFIPFLEKEKFAINLPQSKVDQFVSQEDSIYIKLSAMELAESLEFPPYTDIEKIRYTVKRGDYLGKIAKKHKCTVKDIMLWNDLKTHKIYEGKKLNIYKTVK